VPANILQAQPQNNYDTADELKESTRKSSPQPIVEPVKPDIVCYIFRCQFLIGYWKTSAIK
jgi:hypothetical protein